MELLRTESGPGRRAADLVERACVDCLHRERSRPAAGAQSSTAYSQVAGQELLLRIQSFARSRLADPELGPGMLARHHHISLRYLQKLFKDHGQSPAGWIRNERLSRCRAELRDPRLAHLSVAVIGDRSGLYGASHFSRLFRKRYGVAPGEYRRHQPGLRTAA
ncbi:helix-turn-helix transcriptional regulator [Kitasatospora sp. MAP5-34]|uniref:helix-turn-helix transcriptional regulator n=1 Tax=Kitasatospora sp. MAP5-34 TaxID=3035102 RepID=UPI00247502EE|nr:helix-turn-helix transcriptional regulator [Kitasatospora sp. MAP5-34]MDH6577481.1 transcriptional regulator GlxA family with amidase domain [Kitasatospora sp. MAP5-34]